MDLAGRKAWILPDRGLFVPSPWVAQMLPRLSRDVCALGDRREAGLPLNDAFAQPAINAKIVGTNSASLLESVKPQKNELKTNSKRTQKEAEVSAVMPRIRPNRADSFGVCLPQLRPPGLKCCEAVKKRTAVILSEAKNLRIFWRLDNLRPNAEILRFARDDRFSFSSQGLRQIGKSRKGAKIVGTNSASLLESVKLRKNELKTNSNWSEKSCIVDANSVKQRSNSPESSTTEITENTEERLTLRSLPSVVNLREQSQNVVENKGPLCFARS